MWPVKCANWRQWTGACRWIDSHHSYNGNIHPPPLFIFTKLPPLLTQPDRSCPTFLVRFIQPIPILPPCHTLISLFRVSRIIALRLTSSAMTNESDSQVLSHQGAPATSGDCIACLSLFVANCSPHRADPVWCLSEQIASSPRHYSPEAGSSSCTQLCSRTASSSPARGTVGTRQCHCNQDTLWDYLSVVAQTRTATDVKGYLRFSSHLENVRHLLYSLSWRTSDIIWPFSLLSQTSLSASSVRQTSSSGLILYSGGGERQTSCACSTGLRGQTPFSSLSPSSLRTSLGCVAVGVCCLPWRPASCWCAKEQSWLSHDTVS